MENSWRSFHVRRSQLCARCPDLVGIVLFNWFLQTPKKKKNRKIDLKFCCKRKPKQKLNSYILYMSVNYNLFCGTLATWILKTQTKCAYKYSCLFKYEIYMFISSLPSFCTFVRSYTKSANEFER